MRIDSLTTLPDGRVQIGYTVDDGPVSGQGMVFESMDALFDAAGRAAIDPELQVLLMVRAVGVDGLVGMTA